MKKIILDYIRLVRLGITFSVPAGLASYIFVHCDYVISNLLIYIIVALLFTGLGFVVLSNKLVSYRKKSDAQ